MKYFISEKFGTVYFIAGNDMFGIPIRSNNVLDDDEIFTVTDIEEDENYSLSTDENIELCHDLVKMWIEKEGY